MDIEDDDDFTALDAGLKPVVDRLSRDLRKAAVTLGPVQARFLVDQYYVMQRDRIRANNQRREMEEEEEPHDVIKWLAKQHTILEDQIRGALGVYAAAQPHGAWLMSLCGIGPVIAAGLLCHIDVTKAETVGSVWRFAGLDPTTKWAKNTKRPWNGALKRLCFLAGDSFIKQKSNPKSIYAPLYDGRKAWESQQNDHGKYKEQAALALTTKKYGDDTEAKKHYLAGKLPPARLHMRALRYMVKVFLADYHAVATFCVTGRLPPFPFILNQEGHVHHIAPPHLDRIPGLERAWSRREKKEGKIRTSHADQGDRMERQPYAASAPEQTSEPTYRSVPLAASQPEPKKAKKGKKR
jgi:hypothetical protein